MNKIMDGCPRCERHDATSDGVLVYCVRCGIYAPLTPPELVGPLPRGFLGQALDDAVEDFWRGLDKVLGRT